MALNLNTIWPMSVTSGKKETLQYTVQSPIFMSVAFFAQTIARYGFRILV